MSHGKHPRILFYGREGTARKARGDDGGRRRRQSQRQRQASIGGVRPFAQWEWDRVGLAGLSSLSSLSSPHSAQFPLRSSGGSQRASSNLWRPSFSPLRNPRCGTASIPHYLFYLNNSSVSRSLGESGRAAEEEEEEKAPHRIRPQQQLRLEGV